MIRLLSLLLLVSAALAGETETQTRPPKGGVPAQVGEFPYQVSIQLNKEHFGGGVLISRKHVLTSATVISQIAEDQIAEIQVLAGTINLKEGGQYFGVSHVTVHPGFKYNKIWQSFYNDIAVIHLSEEVPISDSIKPIDLPKDATIPSYSLFSFTGWGSFDNSVGKTVDVLNKSTLKYTSNLVCQSFFVNRRLTSSQLCTTANYSFGTCNTDTGSPLVYQNQVIGISTGFHGCARGIPDVFTRVYSYIQFIQDEINVAA